MIEQQESTLLILGPHRKEAGNEICSTLLFTSTNENAVITVDLTPKGRHRFSPESQAWESTCDLDIITPHQQVYSSLSTEQQNSSSNVAIHSIASPGDLTQLGVVLSDRIDSHEELGDETYLCFDSITTLLQYSQPKRVYQFLNNLVGMVVSSEITAHFHLDPLAHDEQVVRSLRGIFDDVLEI